MECGAMLSRLYEIWPHAIWQLCHQILEGSTACDYNVEKMKYYWETFMHIHQTTRRHITE